MSIERHAGMMQLVCDCGATQPETYEHEDFDVMVADARDAGWKISKMAGEWEHTCPDCAEAARRRPHGRLL
ncbi:MAG: hypothetical protein H6883_07030 [Rhodobiaceae bacterium]|nr:hypothetical protein [Rhodobiaceae bacterium]MCC0055873.1 hypothetical protein [Rhodobiaceae bacterium]